MKKKQRQWMPEARERHRAGCERYHMERRTFEIMGKIFTVLEEISKEQGLDFDILTDAFWEGFNEYSKNESELQRQEIDLRSNLINVARQKQAGMALS